MLHFNHLPFLVTQKIFSYLNLNQKSKASSVCKKWKYEINLFRTDKLCLVNGPDYPYGKRFLFTKELIGYQNSLNILETDFRVFRVRFRAVRKICITNLYPGSYLLSFVNQLKNLKLVQLEINSFCLDRISIESPTLKILSIQDCYLCDIKFDLPVLETLVLYTKQIYRSLTDHELYTLIENKSTLKHLECSVFDKEIEKFTNLETLICKKIDDLEPEFLAKFPNLKKLQVLKSFNRPLSLAMQYALDESNLDYLLFNLDESGEFDHFLASMDEYPLFANKRFLQNHLDKLNKHSYVPFSTTLYFNHLIKALTPNQLDSIIFKKLINIRRVEAFGNSVDEKKFIDFLSKCGPNLKSLKLDKTALPQSFYDKLYPFRSIEHLEISEFLVWKIKNYDFLTNLTNLRTIYTYYDCTIDLKFILAFIDNAFKNSRSLLSFEFGRKDPNIEIIKNGKYYLRATFSLPDDFKSNANDISILLKQIPSIHYEFFFKQNKPDEDVDADVDENNNRLDYNVN